MPAAPQPTDIYDKLGRALKLPAGKLAGLADLQRGQELKKKIQTSPLPLFREVRELLLQKCKAAKRTQVRAIFEKEPFRDRISQFPESLMGYLSLIAISFEQLWTGSLRSIFT